MMEFAQWLKANMEKQLYDRMILWGFSPRHLRLSWEDLTKVSSSVKGSCQDFVTTFTLNRDIIFERLMKKKEKNCLYLYSKLNGTGKTTIVHQIAKDLLDINRKKNIRKMRYIGAVEMFFELKKTFNPSGGLHESEILDSISEADIFFLDDFDKLIRWSQYEKERATLIFDKCYTEMKPIVLTGNKTFEQMMIDNQIESHLYSRFSEMFEIIEVTGEDFRTKVSLKSKENFV